MKNNWWNTLYDQHLADMLLDNSSPKEAALTVDFLIQHLGLQTGQHIFDQCCGTGRLTVELAENHHVIGIDIIDNYIALAKQKLFDRGLSAELDCGDALQFVTPSAVDMVLNWWTSFGYCATDKDNSLMIDNAYQSLKVGGYFALDFMNVPNIFRNFQPHVVTRKAQESGELILVRESSIDFVNNVLCKYWQYFLPDGKRVEHHSQVKLYSPHDLVTLLAQAGFSKITLYGDLDGQPLSLTSPRCIVVGRK